ncbi:MAG TPA: hypothetical protein ENJ18_15440 [Nannocystis exedens]|nr:hypothetical protein [Nannocystis exedens]
MSEPPVIAKTAMTIVDGPERRGSEERWRVRLHNGRPALLGRLLPELADDPAIRRRYVRDLDRLSDLTDCGIAPLVERGPLPDPRDPAAPPPWRLRLEPPGTTLAAWLENRAPAPIDEVAKLGEALALRLAELHDRGVVLRDLAPRGFVIDPEGTIWLTDVGLTRVDILSTRTAASLLVESSPYASPEQLTRTLVDPRSDLFGLGVILYRALTGTLPFGDGPALLRGDESAPPPSTLRCEVPRAFDQLITRCLQFTPEARPATAREVAAVLRGEAPATASMERTTCQSCGASLRLGQRLCLSCGNEAVLFEHSSAAPEDRWALELTKATESTAFSRKLQGILSTLAKGEVPALNLVIGDVRMYSKAELQRRYRLPLRLFDDLSEETALALKERFAAAKIAIKAVPKSMTSKRRHRRLMLSLVGGIVASLAVIIAVFGDLLAGSMVLGAGIVLLSILALVSARRKPSREALFQLRPAPAALPASDPLVSRLASLLHEQPSTDVREQLAELALLTQRLVDHRAQLIGEQAELDRILDPIEPLITLIEQQTHAIIEIDRELADLDEGAMVRALGASEARAESSTSRAPILSGLDRLRTLEDLRARTLHRLLSASDLLRRTADLGLAVRDPETAHRRQIALALHALGAEPNSS